MCHAKHNDSQEGNQEKLERLRRASVKLNYETFLFVETKKEMAFQVKKTEDI